MLEFGPNGGVQVELIQRHLLSVWKKYLCLEDRHQNLERQAISMNEWQNNIVHHLPFPLAISRNMI